MLESRYKTNKLITELSVLNLRVQNKGIMSPKLLNFWVIIHDDVLLTCVDSAALS